MEKIAPELRIILSEKGYIGTSERSLRSPAGDTGLESAAEAITFFLQYRDSLEPLKALGLEVLSESGHVVVGRIALDRLEALAAHPNVILIEKPAPPAIGLDKSIPDIRANQVWSRSGDTFSGRTGKNVVVGIVDTGIDYELKVFRKADNSTRILHIWDQTIQTPQGGESVPGEIDHPTLGKVTLGYGVEYDRMAITNALSNSNPASIVRHKDTDGHGTHVAAIAAGDGSQSDACCGAYTYVGVAPEADLIIVRMRGLTTGDPATSGTEEIDAIRYILNRAAGSPVVINFSIYRNNGRRDTVGSLETGIDNILNAFPQGVAIVFIMGNEGDKSRHATGTVPSGNHIDLKFNVTGSDNQLVDVHYTGTNLRVAVQPQGGTMSAWVNNGGTQTFPGINNGGSVSLSNSDGNIWLRLTPPQTAGRNGLNQGGEWILRLEDTAATATVFHAWSNLKRGPRFVTGGGVTVPAATSVSPYCNSENVITVGAYATEGSQNGQLAAFSSRGPLLRFPAADVRNIRPHVSAPGVGITSAATNSRGGCCCDCCYEFYHDMDGTSQAAPHVTGAVALMLEKNPTRSFSQIRDDLKNSARPVAGQVLPNSDWGWGKLDVKAAVDATPDPPGGPREAAPPPASPAVAAHPAASEREPEPLLALQREFLATPKGRFYRDLVNRHFSEVRTLINTNRRVATVWHRNSGPLLIRMGMQAAYQPERPLPVAIEGITLLDRLNRIAEILKRYGSDLLNRDLEDHIKNWMWVLDQGFSLRQLLDLFRQQEAVVPAEAGRI